MNGSSTHLSQATSFPGLKRNEIDEFGEYRTQRYVLHAYDQLARGELPEFGKRLRGICEMSATAHRDDNYADPAQKACGPRHSNAQNM